MAGSRGGVPCAYCGGHHERAADVRACWWRTAGGAAGQAGGAAGQGGGAAGQADGAEGGLPDAVGSAASWLVPVLGRSVVVAPGQPAPPAWAGCERLGIGLEALEALEEAWRTRRPVVIESSGEPAADEVEQAPVWSLAPSFAFPGERLAHAVDANAVDARGATPRFPLAEAALRLGAAPGGPADVLLPDGRPAYLDGGPLEWTEPVGGAVVVPALFLAAGRIAGLGGNESVAELAADQLAAVTHCGGAARVIAPAGSGKTRVLTERARHLLRAWGLPGRAMTLVAFNKRAAEEMRARTSDLPELRVRTLNALGLSLLSGEQPTTIEERDVRAILDSLVDLPRRANADPAAAWIEALSAVRLGLQDPAEVEAELGGDVDGLAEVFDRYRRLLADRRLVDFDEQVYRAIEVLLADPAARRVARAACRVLLVDEFQDLTPAHLLLVRLLAGPEGAVFAVGDDDQTIYGYSGASPEWLIDYRRFFPAAGEHALEVNYRCPPAVVEAARTLLTHNRRRVEKRIVAAPGRRSAPGELSVAAGTDALGATVERVAGLVGDGATPAEVAVLTRVNASLAPVQVALHHRRIAVQAAVGPAYLSRGGIQAALAWLRLALAGEGRLPRADVVLAARRPSRALSPRVLDWMGEQDGVAGLERLAGRLKEKDAERILGFVGDLRRLQASAGERTAADLLRSVRDEVGLDGAMELLERSRRRLDRSAQTDDLDALVSLASLHPEPHGFEEWLRRSLAEAGDAEGVTLATIHRVKGREWPHVVLHDVREGLLPHRLATDLEEERRVLHVGLTRACASVQVVPGDPPSSFLAELAEQWRPRPAAPPRPSAGAPAPARATSDPAVGWRTGRRPPNPERVVPGGGGPVPPEAERARQALRAWRSAKAAAEGKPPYVYLHDHTLEALATRLPATMAAMARVKGIGPAKLEAYGDELLALLAAAREAG